MPASSRTTIEVFVASDGATPRGTAFLAVNRAGPGAADLIDVDAPVTDLRVVTFGGSAAAERSSGTGDRA